jgi:hypothetical protein
MTFRPFRNIFVACQSNLACNKGTASPELLNRACLLPIAHSKTAL